MARTEHLPLYRASYDLCLYLERVVQRFSRYHKYTLGTDLRDAARRALKLVVRANSQRDRVATLLASTSGSAGPDRRIRQLAPRGAAGNKWSGQ